METLHEKGENASQLSFLYPAIYTLTCRLNIRYYGRRVTVTETLISSIFFDLSSLREQLWKVPDYVSHAAFHLEEQGDRSIETKCIPKIKINNKFIIFQGNATWVLCKRKYWSSEMKVLENETFLSDTSRTISRIARWPSRRGRIRRARWTTMRIRRWEKYSLHFTCSLTHENTTYYLFDTDGEIMRSQFDLSQ